MTVSSTGPAGDDLRTEHVPAEDATAQVAEQIRRILANPRRTRR